MKIRAYSPDDLTACRRLWAAMTAVHRELFDDPTIGGDDPGSSFDRHIEMAGEQDLMVAEIDGFVVAMAGLVIRDREVLLEPMVVEERHRRRGIGRALMARISAEALSQGLPCLSVHPLGRNEVALSFFHACGFDSIGTVELYSEIAPGRRVEKPEARAGGAERTGKKVTGSAGRIRVSGLEFNL